jgi:alpha-L-arabinofuranosidase
VEADRWYDIRVEVTSARIRCYLDGKLVHDVEDLPPSPIHAVAGRVDRTGELIVKMVNAGDQPQPLRLDFRGVPALADRAEVTVLTSAKPEDENTLEAPLKVAPVTARLTGVRSGMQHVLPAHSLTILRVRPVSAR